MDLSRWNIPTLSKIKVRYRDFREFLGDVLEGERSLVAEDAATVAGREKAEAFDVSNDWASLDRTLASIRAETRGASEQAFESLAPFFEAGFLLNTANGESRLKSMFLFGRTFFPPEPAGSPIDLGLSPLTGGLVLRGRTQPVLKVVQLDGLKSLSDSQVFAFSPTKGVTFVLVCNRPHPWQVGAIENAYLATRTALMPKQAAAAARASVAPTASTGVRSGADARGKGAASGAASALKSVAKSSVRGFFK